MSGSTQIQWGEDQERAFLDLKETLCKDPMLQSPNFEEHFPLQTNASGVGLGAVLLQGEGEGMVEAGAQAGMISCHLPSAAVKPIGAG